MSELYEYISLEEIVVLPLIETLSTSPSENPEFI